MEKQANCAYGSMKILEGHAQHWPGKVDSNAFFKRSKRPEKGLFRV
jgi:hypothetical protein